MAKPNDEHCLQAPSTHGRMRKLQKKKERLDQPGAERRAAKNKRFCVCASTPRATYFYLSNNAML
jgi:hypothetical protein